MISKHRTWNNGLGNITLLDCIHSIVFDIGEDNNAVICDSGTPAMLINN